MKNGTFQTLLILLAAGALSGCVSSSGGSAQGFLLSQSLPHPVTKSLSYCSDHGCRKKTRISLAGKNWSRIRRKFKRRHSAASERRAIASAMAIFEKVGGRASGSSADRPRTQFNSNHQLDCIDEAANMTTLLVLLNRAGLLRYNKPAGPSSRPVSGGNRWPHFAGTVVEKRTGRRYVIDSWFRPNGKPAVVVPLKKWKTGWSV